MQREAVLEAGWGRLVFGQTFGDHKRLRDVLRDELAPRARDDEHAGWHWLPDGERLYASLIRAHTTIDPSPMSLHELGRHHTEELLPREYTRIAPASLGTDDLQTIFHRLRTKSAIAEAYKFYGVLYRETGRPEQSDTHFALSLGMAEACQNRLLQAETQMEWALLHLEEERKQEGVLYLNRSLQIFRDLKAGREVLDIERRLDRLRELYLPAVQGWGAKLAEGKDPYQVGHAQRVADYATKLGREVGVAGWDLTWLRIGAFIHDLGNMAVPEDVLRKVDDLDDQERELMKVHTIMGDSMAKQLDFPAEVRPVVRSHHEQWAGTGYPDRLVGEQIPFGARIVSLADVYDALTSPRSFRAPYSRDEAMAVMKRDSEKMFDPQLFGVFEDMMRRGGFDD